MIPPYPYYKGDPRKFNIEENLDDVLFARPLLMFTARLRPIGGTPNDEFELPLIFYSAFKRTMLTPHNIMQSYLDIVQLYEPGPWPSLEPVLHVDFLCNVLCRAPLVPCYINGNRTPTIPRSLRNLKNTQFPHGRADSEAGKGDGSKVYEVNDWLWKFGRGMPRTVTVAQAERMRETLKSQTRRKAWATRKRNAEMRDHE